MSSICLHVIVSNFSLQKDADMEHLACPYIKFVTFESILSSVENLTDLNELLSA